MDERIIIIPGPASEQIEMENKFVVAPQLNYRIGKVPLLIIQLDSFNILIKNMICKNKRIIIF
jgi:hypothetical protein